MAEYCLYDVPAWVRPSIQATLDPGEHIEAFCDFCWPANPQIARTVVLTNRNLRFVGFKATWFTSSKPQPVVFNFTIPLHTITAVGVTRVPGGLFRQAQVTIQVHWSGAPEVWTSTYGAGDDLARGLEAVLAKRTAAAQGSGIADEIAKLGALASEGVITPEEFERGKALFLGREPDQAAETVSLLRQLHGLYVGKVLSQSEFNMKKWDLLSR